MDATHDGASIAELRKALWSAITDYDAEDTATYHDVDDALRQYVAASRVGFLLDLANDDAALEEVASSFGRKLGAGPVRAMRKPGIASRYLLAAHDALMSAYLYARRDFGA